MKKILLICIGLLFLGCSIFKGAKNSKYAYYTFKNNVYSIELSGQRTYMAHDPISAIKGDTYPVQMIFIVPKIKGIIKGKDIISPKEDNVFEYLGEIKIHNGKMSINLEYKYFDNETPNSPVSWNGKYTLMEKKGK